MGRKRVAQCMWTDSVYAGANFDVLLHHPAYRACCNSRSLVIKKQSFFSTPRDWRIHEEFVAHLEVIVNCLRRRIAKGHNALLATFAGDSNELVSKVDVCQI